MSLYIHRVFGSIHKTLLAIIISGLWNWDQEEIGHGDFYLVLCYTAYTFLQTSISCIYTFKAMN